MSKYIESAEATINKEFFKGSDPKEENFVTENGPVKYFEQKLFYNYGTVEEPIVQDLLIEGPLMKAQGLRIRDEGIKKSRKGQEYRKITHSMIFTFDLADPRTKEDSKKALESFREVYLGCAKALAPYKGKVGLHHFQPEHPEGTLKDFLYWPTDNNGIIPGRNPSIWANFVEYGPGKTLITDLNGRPIDWELLKDSDMEIVPLFHVTSNFLGSVKKVKVNLRSAIVVKITPTGSETCQTSTLDKLKAKYGSGKVDEVEAQLAELRMNKQEQLQHPPAEFGSPNYTQSQFQEEVTNTESVQDFLAGAPTMEQETTTLPKIQTLKLN